jgi:hypothetical protein
VLITRTRTSPECFGASRPSTTTSFAGRGFKLSSSNACLQTCASRPSSLSSLHVPRATRIGSTSSLYFNFHPLTNSRFPASFNTIRFLIKGTHIVNRTFVTARDPLVAADIQRREERCRRSGGIGTAVVLIQCGAVSQVMPVEVDAPARIPWDERNDWAAVLAHYVDSGRTDFKPISTTSRG